MNEFSCGAAKLRGSTGKSGAVTAVTKPKLCRVAVYIYTINGKEAAIRPRSAAAIVGAAPKLWRAAEKFISAFLQEVPLCVAARQLDYDFPAPN